MFAGFFCVETLTGNVQTKQDENPEYKGKVKISDIADDFYDGITKDTMLDKTVYLI